MVEGKIFIFADKCKNNRINREFCKQLFSFYIIYYI
jgi:hypothetical protein